MVNGGVQWAAAVVRFRLNKQMKTFSKLSSELKTDEMLVVA